MCLSSALRSFEMYGPATRSTGLPGTMRVSAKTRKSATRSTGTMKRRRRAAYRRRRVEPCGPYSAKGLSLVHVCVPVQLVVVIDVPLYVAPEHDVPVRSNEERVGSIGDHELLSVLAALDAALLVQRQRPLTDQRVDRWIGIADIVGRAGRADVPAHVVPRVIDPGKPLIDPHVELAPLLLLVERREGDLLDRHVESDLLQVGLDEHRGSLRLLPVRQ